MHRIDRYLIRSVAFPMMLAVIVVGFLVVANELREQSHRLIAEVLTAWDIVVLGAAFLPSLLPLILPVAFFFGVLMGYGKLAEHGEITAMRAAGVSLARLTVPIFALGLAVTAGTIALQDRLQPLTMVYVRDFFRVELPRRATLDTLSPGVMHALGDWRVYFGARDEHTHTLSDVTIVYHGDDKGTWVYQADSAKVSANEAGPTLLLEGVHLISPDGFRGSFQSQPLELAAATSRIDAPQSRNEKSLKRLLAYEHELRQRYEKTPSFAVQKDLRETRHDIANRLSLPFAAVLLGCVGAPIAAESSRFRRAGRQRLLTLGLVPVFLYYFARVVLGPNSLMPLNTVLLISWLPNLGLLALAAIVFIRTARVH